MGGLKSFIPVVEKFSIIIKNRSIEREKNGRISSL
jgi:hypothetical protein